MANPSTTTAPPSSEYGLGVDLNAVSKTFPRSSKTVGPVNALTPLSLQIAPGSFTAVLGPSGCGKSTLLRLIASLDSPTAGDILFTHADGTKVSQGEIIKPSSAHAQLAYVFQDAHLLPWRSVWRNVALPLELMHSDAATHKQTAMQALERVGLLDAADRYPAQLSGGMRMRVSLARAMVTKPRLLLLDEPFAALDEITRQQLDQQLRKLWRNTGMTVIFVTHSTAEATFLAQRAVVLSSRPGRVVHDQPIDLPEDRSSHLRGDARFAKASATLYAALEQGMHLQEHAQ